MISTSQFDSRLIWKTYDENNKPESQSIDEQSNNVEALLRKNKRTHRFGCYLLLHYVLVPFLFSKL